MVFEIRALSSGRIQDATSPRHRHLPHASQRAQGFAGLLKPNPLNLSLPIHLSHSSSHPIPSLCQVGQRAGE